MARSCDEAFVQQLLACQSRLYCFVATMVVNRTDAEDLVQQAGLEAWRCREGFDPAREFFPWICGIARNHIRNYYRSQKAAPLPLPDDIVEQLLERHQADEPLLQRRQQALTLCLEKLPPRQRDFVCQFYATSQTARSFAEQQAITADAAYKSLQRIRAALFACINRTLAETMPC